MARARALVARSDTLASARELAMAFAPGAWQNAEAEKAIVRQLSASVDGVTWSAFSATEKADARRCALESAARYKSEGGTRWFSAPISHDHRRLKGARFMLARTRPVSHRATDRHVCRSAAPGGRIRRSHAP